VGGGIGPARHDGGNPMPKTQTSTPKLSDTQLVMLSAASQRGDHALEDTDEDRTSLAAAAMPRKRKTAAARPKPQAASPTASKQRSAPTKSKQDLVIQMLRRQSGVTIDDIVAKTGWQRHSVRGFFSGLVRKKLNLPLVSDVGKDGMRRYHIASVASSKA
jgi:hypothetical protein